MRRTALVVLLILVDVLPAAAQTPNTITTIAGGGAEPSTAMSAYLPQPFAAVRDKQGNTYISVPTRSTVYKVDTTGTLTAYAGTGIFGFSGDGGPAAQAQISQPTALALDANGNLFIADSFFNHRIRRVDNSPQHIITTVAGSEANGFGILAGDGGLATNARLNEPQGVAVDANGNVFIADTLNNVIRRVDAVTQIIERYAGTGQQGTRGQPNGDGNPATQAQLNGPKGIAFDSAGNLFIADTGDSVIRKVDDTANHTITTYAGGVAACAGETDGVGDGCPAIQAVLNRPEGVFVDSMENLLLADSGHSRIRKVDNTANHIIATIVGTGTACTDATTNCGDGGAPLSALLNKPTGVFMDSSGVVVIADTGNQRVRLVSAGGTPTITNFAGGGSGGDDIPATSAILGVGFNPIAIDGSGNLFIIEAAGLRLRRVDAKTQTITTVAGNGLEGVIGQPNGDGGPATKASFGFQPLGLAVDAAGNLYISDTDEFRVRVVNMQLAAITVAGVTIQPGDIATIAGNGLPCGSGAGAAPLPGCGDGGPATSASLGFPEGVAVDSQGNVYIADPGLAGFGLVNRIRIVDTAGTISNFAGTGTACPSPSSACGNGGPALQAQLNGPFGIAFDTQSNLFFVDGGNSQIRKIDNTAQHVVSLVAFNGEPTFGGDGGPATLASMEFPAYVALDPQGNLFVGGGFDNIVQRIDAQSGTIVTVAGDVNNLDGGFSGDGGPSTKAMIGNSGLAVDSFHNLLIADFLRIRKVNLAPVALVQPDPTLSFATTLAGATSDPRLITIINNGLDSLIISNVSASPISGVFVVTNLCTTPVAPGSSCLIEIVLAPPVGIAAGPVNGMLSFSTNDPANPTLSSALSGTISSTPATLSITEVGTGTVTSDPAGINCPTTCSATFAQGATVTLTAIGTGADAFTGWNNGNAPGAPNCTPTTVTPCSVTLSFSQTLGANFAAGTFRINISILGNGSGNVTSSPTDINNTTCTPANSPCAFTFPASTLSVTLTPTAGNGSVFAGWTGSCFNMGVGPCSGLSAGKAGGAAVFSGPAQPFAKGQVFLSTDDGMVFVYNANGTIARVLNSGPIGGRGNGLTFDSAGNLYMANSDAQRVEFFTNQGAGPTLFGSTYTAPFAPAVAASGNVLVSQLIQGGGSMLLEFPAGAGSEATPITTFFPAYEGDSSVANWIEPFNTSQAIAYTLGTQTVKVFDRANQIQLPDLATNMHGAFALRELPDQTMLVADTDRIVRLDQNGSALSPYPITIPGATLLQNLNLDPDGVTFWTNDETTGTVYRINIASGTVTSQFGTGLPLIEGKSGIGGIAVFDQPQAGGVDLAISMNAPADAQLGANLTYTLQVTNNGPSNATGVTVTDTLPSGLTATNFSSGCSGTTTITCTIGSLNNGQSVSLNITVVPNAAGTTTNAASVSGGQPDPNPSNNSAAGSTTVVTNGFALTVEVDSTNSADFVTSSPTGIDCFADQACTQFFASGTSVALTANGPGFLAWDVNGSTATCPGTGTCTLTMNQQFIVIAVYASPVAFTVSGALAEGVVGVPYSQDLSQGILGGTSPYTFAISSGTLPGGLGLSSGGGGNVNNRLSGTPTTAGTFSVSITVTDSSTPTKLTATFNTSITIITAPSTAAQLALLNGQYDLLFRGVSDADASLRDAVAAMNFDGKGKILNGGTLESNGNGPNGTYQLLTITGGTYTIGLDFRGLATVNLSDGTTRIFAFAVGDVYKTTGFAYTAYVIEFDDKTGTGTRGAGLLKRVDPNALTAASLAGTYTSGFTGEDIKLNRVTLVGMSSVSATGTITNVNDDLNDNGTLSTETLVSGTYGTDGANGAISPVGRTQYHLNLMNSINGAITSDQAVYIVDANTLFRMKIDSGATHTLHAGTSHRQDPGIATLAAGVLAGPDVLNLQGPSGGTNSSNSAVLLGLLTKSGGTATLNYDANNDMAIQLNATQSGPVSIGGGGRASIALATNPLIAYFWGQDNAYVMETGADPGFGTIEFQHGGPFPNATFTDFILGTREPASPSGGPVTSGVFTVGGAPVTINVTEDFSHERGTLEYGSTFVLGFSESAAGRVVDVGSSASDPALTIVGYSVSPARSFNSTIDPTEHHPHINETISITMPPGVPSPASTSVNFPNPVQIGSNAQSATLAFTNTGDGLLSFTGVTNATDFSFSGSCIPTAPATLVTLIPGGTCTGLVTFAPTANTQTGVQLNETITLQSDAGNVTIKASGQAAAATQTFQLTVTLAGTGTGTVTSQTGLSPAIDCFNGATSGCTATYSSGTSVTLTATPTAANGSVFTGWTVNGSTTTCSGTGTCTVTMSQAQNVTATFNLPATTFGLSVALSGSNGSVVDQNNPSGIHCSITGGQVTGTCSFAYASGAAVSLKVSLGINSASFSWTAGPCNGTSTNPCNFNITSNTNASAVFAGVGPTFTSTTLPAGAVGVPYGADLANLVSGGQQPYSFRLTPTTGNALPAGFTLDTASAATVLSGHIFNDSPATANTFTFSITVTDSTSPTPLSTSATISLTIGAAPANTQAGLMKGQWALLVRAYSENGGDEEGDIASLNFDGVNAVTGVVDINSTNGIQQHVPVTGTYAVGPDNRMFVTLTTQTCQSPPCTVSFAMAVGNVYRSLANTARITQFNDDNGNDHLGSGFMLRQDPTALTQNSFAATYVYQVTGQTPSLQREVESGIITFDNLLNVKSGSADVNRAGTMGSITSITGTYTAPDANGRIVLSLTLTPGSPSTTVVYIVSANQVVAMNLDPRANNALLIGSALRQANPGTFGAGSIAGPDILTLEGLESDGGFDVIVARATAASGTFSATFDEESDGKTPTIGGVTSGPVTVAANGRLSTNLTAGAGNGSTLIVYFAAPDRGYAMGSGTVAPAGELKPQVVPQGGFSATPFTGNGFFGLQELLGPNGTLSGVAALQSGTATFNITDDESHKGGDLGFDQSPGSIILTVASDGSFTEQGTQKIGSGAGYVVSPFEFDLIDTTNSTGPSFHPNVIVAQSIAAPPGTPSPAAMTVTFTGTVTIGSTAQSSPFTITNTGLGPLGITGVNNTNSPDFKVDPASTCVGAGTVVIQPFGTCILITDFAPTTNTSVGTVLSENLILQTDGTTNITITDQGTAAAASAADFSLLVGPASNTVATGNSATYNVTLGSLNNFTGNVSLTVSGLPTGANGTFQPNPAAVSATGGGTSGLTVTTSSNTPPGTYTLTIKGTSGSLSHNATVQLVVTATPDFTLSAMPPSQTVTAGVGTTYTVNAAALNGFTGNVALTVSGLPTGATGTFNPASITPGTPSTLTVTTATTTPAGTPTLTITGTNGNLVHTATVQLIVNQVLVSISVAPASATVLVGTTQQYTANGIFGDKSTKNITNSVTWGSSNTNIATISNATGTQGLATAVKAGGPVTISATQSTIQGTASLTVTDFTVSVTPASQTVSAGNSTTYTVNAAALNGFTGSVALTVSGLPTGATAAFSPASIAPGTPSTLTVATVVSTPAGTPTLTISGASGGVVRTATVQLTVNQVLVSIAVTPNPANVGPNNTVQFTATGKFGDNSTQNLTTNVQWSSSDPTIATISNATGSQGLATGVKSGGPITITATAVQTEVSGTAQLTVSSITLQPPPGQPLAPPPVPPGGTLVMPIVLTVPPGTKGTVTLTCTVTSQTVPNASEFANCVPVPSQVPLTGSGSVNTALAVKFFCSDVPGMPSLRKMPGGLNGPFGMFLVILAGGGMVFTLRRRPRCVTRWAMSFAVLALIAFGTASCANPGKGPNGATPAGNYTITLTATLNGQSASLNIPVTVE